MNKREYSRIDFIGSADVLYRGVVHKVRVLDLSAQGMQISWGAGHSLKIGEEVIIRLNIYQDEDAGYTFSKEFEFNTVVVHVDEGSLGIKILSTTVDCFMRLISIVIKHDGDADKIKSEIKKAESHFKFQKGTGAVAKALLKQEI